MTDPHDIDQIRAVVADVAAGVTAQDADRCAAHFTAEARSVIATGQRSIGRDAIRDAHEAAFASGQTPTRARFDVLDTVFVRPDVAVVTTGGWAVVEGEEVDLDRPGTVLTWVMVREVDAWMVAARQFTRVAA